MWASLAALPRRLRTQRLVQAVGEREVEGAHGASDGHRRWPTTMCRGKSSASTSGRRPRMRRRRPRLGAGRRRCRAGREARPRGGRRGRRRGRGPRSSRPPRCPRMQFSRLSLLRLSTIFHPETANIRLNACLQYPVRVVGVFVRANGRREGPGHCRQHEGGPDLRECRSPPGRDAIRAPLTRDQGACRGRPWQSIETLNPVMLPWISRAQRRRCHVPHQPWRGVRP